MISLFTVRVAEVKKSVESENYEAIQTRKISKDMLMDFHTFKGYATRMVA